MDVNIDGTADPDLKGMDVEPCQAEAGSQRGHDALISRGNCAAV